mgnify:CR=1 FL=1
MISLFVTYFCFFPQTYLILDFGMGMENNPYDILGVSQSASKVEITKAVPLAMKRKQYPVDVIAKAQKSLMKSEERIIADYFHPI